MLFDQWTGDTQFVNNVAYTNALVSMPTNAVTLTATYAATGYVSYSTAPYQQNMSSTGIVIMCELPQEIPLHLEYGQTAAYGQTAQFVSEPNAGGTWFYRALVTGLEPAQTYHYRLVQNSGASADDTFATSPTNSVDFSFGVWSDGHGENYGWTLDPTEPVRSFLKQMVGAGVAFALSVGDMVGQGTNYSHVRTSYLDCVARELGPHVPWYIAWGNHDSILTNAALRRAADLPSRNRPGFSSGHGSYTFTYANCFFVCIDEFQRSTINNGWLQQELSSAAAQQARFRIVAVHYPPYSERWLDGNAALRSDLVPLMEQYDVDLCISGHVHEYERGETNGVKYVITGASCNLDTKEVIVKDWPHMTVGGAQTIAGYRRTQSSPGVLGPEIPIVGGLVNEYSFIQVIGDVLKFECRAFNSDGSYIGVLDSFELQARPQP
jgi:Icc-related predicted phosphoesterase